MARTKSILLRRKYLLSRKEDTQLQTLAEEAGMNQSEFVRCAIRETYDDLKQGIPIETDEISRGRTSAKHIGMSKPDCEKLQFICKELKVSFAVGVRTVIYYYSAKKFKFRMKA